MLPVVLILVHEPLAAFIAVLLYALDKDVRFLEVAELDLELFDGEVGFHLLLFEVVDCVESLAVDDADSFIVNHFHA